MEYKLPPLPDARLRFEIEVNQNCDRLDYSATDMRKYAEQAVAPLLADPKIILDQMTDEQRSDLFVEYCRYCGCKDPKCQCWNDE